MDYQERNTLLVAITKDVATALGMPWAFSPMDEPYPTQYIQGEGLAKLSLSIEYNHTDRISISGVLNIGKNGQYVVVYDRDNGNNRAAVPTITVAINRGAAAIAKAIVSRLIPEYFRILNIAIDQMEKSNAYESARNATLSKLAAIVNASAPKEDADRFSFYHSERAYGTVWAGDKSANLDLHNLTIEQAEYILTYLERKA